MELIKKLRNLTHAGMVDCQKALKEANNDFDLAVDILRKKGISKASKRAEREATEGLILCTVNEGATEGYILELNSETDFVARNEEFQAFANKLMTLIKTEQPAKLDDLFALSLGEQTVADAVSNLSGVIGEKIELNRFAIVKGETVASYSHQAGRIGVLVALDKADQADLALDLAMHIAASSPKYLRSEEVTEAEIEHEKSIYREQLLNEGKPEAMIDKISEGKLQKFYSEICLLDQEYIKDDKKKVKEILGDTNILAFVRYSL